MGRIRATRLRRGWQSRMPPRVQSQIQLRRKVVNKMALTIKSNQSDLDVLLANLQTALDAVNAFELKYSLEVADATEPAE